MPLTLIQGGRTEKVGTPCNAIVGYTGQGEGEPAPVACNGRGYAETAYKDTNGHWRRRVTVCPECVGRGNG